MAGWSTGRPIYDRLPAESGAYQGNPVADALTRPYDDLLIQWRDAALNFEADYLNPTTCRADALDWLAQLCGFTGQYWDPRWTEAQKRELISESHLFVWPNKGTQILLEWLFDLFVINARIYQVGQFLVGTNKIGDALGGRLMQYWILMPLSYRRDSEEWDLVERLNRLYMPCFAESAVCYEKFYVGFSLVGDPIL